MSVKPNLSVWGVYNYDKTKFETFLHLPESFDADQKRQCINNILVECSDLQLLYPDPAFLYLAMDAWSFKQRPIWNEIIRILGIDYDPQYNYSKYEDVTDETLKTGTDTKDMSGTDTVVRTGTDTMARTGTIKGESSAEGSRELDKTDNRTTTVAETEEEEKREDSETINAVNGFNTTQGQTPLSMVNHDKSDVTDTINRESEKNSSETMARTIDENESTSDSTESTTTNNLLDTETKNLQDVETRAMRDVATKNLRDYLTHHGHSYGNIGTMTTQQMLREELELRKINIYDIIVNDFKKQFCLGVYY